ncbi:MAG: glutamate synthase subunit alpha, partial [Sphingobacteriia bacterium]
LAILSNEPQHLSHYFKQVFAQVTNPPIDPIRERSVMSLSTFAGSNGNLLTTEPAACHSVALQHPVLNNHELEKIRSIDTGIFQAKTLQTYFRATHQPGALKSGLERLCRYAVDAVEDGFEVIILSDRAIDSDHAPIPSLLATAAVHHHLIRKGYRSQVGLIVEAGDVWEVHHFACLIGFGATAINPYLALSTIRDMKNSGLLVTDLGPDQLKKNYVKAVCEGLLKVFSKMGISTLQSYQGAQIFEILGIENAVVEQYFTGAISRIGGLDLDGIARETLTKHHFAFSQPSTPNHSLPGGGLYQWKPNGIPHLWNPQTIHLLQQATRNNDYDTYKRYARLINHQEQTAAITLRSQLQFQPN